MADVPRRKAMPAGYQAAPQPSNIYGHSRTRTTSSNTFPAILQPHHAQQHYPSNLQINAYTSRRTPSTNTFSTTASSGNGPVGQRPVSQDLRRSTSSRSGGSPSTSYVALMRKQKATVWCDRSQHEDPRLVAAQRQAKIRATMEVSGGGGQARLSTTGSGNFAASKGVTAKIRHHGKSGLVGYSPGDLAGGVAGVPMRLSATEVEGEDSDDDSPGGTMQSGGYHRRTGSGRSSVGSGGRRGLTYSRQSGSSSIGGKWSSGNTPPGERQNSLGDLAEADTPAPAPAANRHRNHYFGGDGTVDRTQSVGSGSSGERADNVPDLGADDAARLASNSLMKSTITREKSTKNPDELRRRGSVDERTMTMSAGRLYVANPDTDSD
ncbi:Uncharacterized protein BP5553_03026 [Venustampulla echinocandica]|uniref:Uncharacterized protein n=1 Tax=Venustampulla echinocandica TaxID=2656787 RepID=A0A370TT32_9HELO|nr:Uncharacterized protein BP5553_03026 [Venustampulla echinocandica]RDL38686.1 Uncharacterized protein BP5553_03026 [Venustampulla echinocandica]